MRAAFVGRLIWYWGLQQKGVVLLAGCTLALGLTFLVMAVAIYTSMGEDPIPNKSQQLYAVQLDSWDEMQNPAHDTSIAPYDVTYTDARDLPRALPAIKHNASFRASGLLTTQGFEAPFLASVRVTDRNFFEMFEVPFEFGTPWNEQADVEPMQVVVLSNKTNQKLFGGANSVGRAVQLDQRTFVVGGVLRPWLPMPRFYDVSAPFDEPENAYIPFSLIEPLQLRPRGALSCWRSVGTSHAEFLASECLWIQLWAELPASLGPGRYLDDLRDYADEQHARGRFPRNKHHKVHDVKAWLKYRAVVTEENKALVLLGVLFLGASALNSAGLLLIRGVRRSGQIAVHRAVGAPRVTLFLSFVGEAILIALVAGAIAIPLSILGLTWVRLIFPEYQYVAQMGWENIAHAIVFAVLAGVAAGVYPAWKVTIEPPMKNLKTL